MVSKEDVKVLKKTGDDENFIEECAKVVVDYVGSLDPQWDKRLKIAMDEKGWTNRQLCGSLMGVQLDRGLHLETPTHILFEPGVKHFSTKECPECQKAFTPKIAGQVMCSEACGLAAARKRKAARDEEVARSAINVDAAMAAAQAAMGPPPPVR